MKGTTRTLLVPLVLVGLVAAACGSDAEDDGAAATKASAVQGDITVFAAASLVSAFTAAGDAFTRANPDARVTFSFDASSALVQQITQGAPADVFASADTANMDKLTRAGLNGSDPVVFATNSLEVIVAPGNPKDIGSVADLAEPGLKVVLCAAEVPCGKYAAQVLTTAGVTLTPVSLEQNVKGVVTKVTVGEADAGIVYRTDVNAAGDKAAGVSIPSTLNVVAKYPVASVKTSKEAATDAAFIQFLLGPDGQAILASFGFGPP